MNTLQKLDEPRLLEIRRRLIRMHYESGVGHVGGNLSSIDALALLFNEYMGPSDHFVLSKGHSAGALYTALWSAGKLDDSQLATFHKDDTLLAGHPPASGIPEIMFATGSLGHGLSLAAGTALADRMHGKNNRVFCLTSDGEWQEGSTWEALIFASHQQLANLTILVDHNQLQGFGATDAVASMAPLWEKIRGFDVEIEVVPGHDLPSIRKALDKRHARPHIIVLQTTKGKGVSFMENRMEWHYLPINETQYNQAIAELTQS
ncbi:transketolase [Trinickia violacea]|uniref:Transketolase n=1 Tax=Trinickia violacea TaxID=2571746 RepID=A0A4V1EHM2_9BURK|nr:transketolase [Trinickia violacea]QCP50760.1 transketolase [Trinickia violacea]